MILKEYEISMTYEELAKSVFDCDRGEGPYNCANASVYDFAFVPTPNRLGRLIMKCMIDRIINDGDYTEENIDLLLDKRIRLTEAADQQEVIDIILELIDFLNDNGY